MARRPSWCGDRRIQLRANDSQGTGDVEIHRELRHLDLVGQGMSSRFVVENKLYSLPYPAQLQRYLQTQLPWSKDHGGDGAPGTTYTLLSLMAPSFDPAPWVLVTYAELGAVLDGLELDAFGADAELLGRYRALVRRLVDLEDIVDPSSSPDAPFLVNHLLGQMDHKWFDGPLQRMRFSSLGQAVHRGFPTARGAFAVGFSNARGILEYFRPLSGERSIGWQLQGDGLRIVLLIHDDELAGKGDQKKSLRAELAASQWLDWFDFTAADEVLGSFLHPKSFAATDWNHYDPDFVYRWRKVDALTPSSLLADALVALTRRTDGWLPDR